MSSATRHRQRSLWEQFWAVTADPVNFFKNLSLNQANRSWLLAAALISMLIGLSATYRHPSVVTPANVTAPAQWIAALLAVSEMLITWCGQALILAEVTLINGYAPSLMRNMQIAVWSSVPLGIMAALQLIFYNTGGSSNGAPGISGLLNNAQFYQTLSPYLAAIVTALFSRITIFWVWHLILLFLGARHALSGKLWAALLVIAAWILIMMVVPATVEMISMGT